MDWNCVDYFDVFISCLDPFSDGTHSLQMIHWWASDVMLHFSKSDEEKLIYILDGLRVKQLSAHWLNWGYSFSEKDPYIECCSPDWITAIINRFKVHFLTHASNNCYSPEGALADLRQLLIFGEFITEGKLDPIIVFRHDGGLSVRPKHTQHTYLPLKHDGELSLPYDVLTLS